MDTDEKSALHSTTVENEALVERFFANLSAGDYAALRSMFTEESVWFVVPRFIPGAGAHTGPKGIVDDFLMPIRSLFVEGDPTLAITNSFGKGRFVAVETHTRGTLKNGKSYDQHYCWIIEIRGGTLQTVREYMDGGYVASLM